MIRVAVGCAANGDDIESQQVLEYTIRKHATQPVEILWMKLSRDPDSPFYSDGKNGWQTHLWSTPFSGFRWAVPALFGFKGRAIYMDSDCIVQADLAKLMKAKFEPGKIVMAKGGAHSWRFCVSVWDCAAYEKAVPILASGGLCAAGAHRQMIQFFKDSPHLIQPFIGNWNCIDGEDYKSLQDPGVKIIHYSSEAHQPHLKYAAPRMAALGKKHWFDGERKLHWRADLRALFDKLLKEAESAGYTAARYAAPDYGAYQIANHKNYKGHQWAK